MTGARSDAVVRYRFADLTLCPGQRLVARGNRQIPLGKLSYELLRVLVESAPNVVMQSECLDSVWKGRVVVPETLTQRVLLLRRALSDAPDSPRYIGLVRGCGYRLLPAVRAERERPPSRRVLAVLPFESLSRDPDKAFFAAGLYEEMLSQLCKLEDTDIVARTRVAHYEDRSGTLMEVSAELGVDQIMVGGIRYAKEKVRITARLIDGASGTHLWADAHDYELGDDFRVQSSAAERIARAIGCRGGNGARSASPARLPDLFPETRGGGDEAERAR